MATYYYPYNQDPYLQHAPDSGYAYSVSSSYDLSPKSEFSDMDDFECNKPFNLPSLSPPHSAGSMTIKTVSPFNDDLFQFEEKAVPLIEKSKAVPTASADAAAASLQTAFCRRPSHSLKMNSVLSEPLHHQDQSFAFYDDSKTSTGNNNQFSENNNQAQSEQDGNNDDAQQMEIYRDLILRHLIQDISTTCSKLGLPTDAINWSEEHGSRWINEMCQQFNLNPPRRPFLNGRTLLNMSETEFRNLSPEGGDTLYAQLQLWKTAFETYHDQQCSGQSARMTAADSSTSKDSSNWSFTSGNSSCLTSPIDDNISKKGISNFPRFNGDRTNNAGANGNPPNLCFYNGAQFAGSHIDNNAQSPYFMQRNMSSPCNSEMSSSGSIQELPEDDSKEFPMNFLHMQNDMHFCQQDPANPSDYHMNSSRSSEDAEPRSPFPRHSGTVHLWHFIRELLDQPKQYGSCVRWVDREEGTFKIESSHHLARFWGQRKNRSQMNYDKLSRSLRQYYKKGIIQKPEKKQRLVYKFLPPYNL